MVAWAPLAAAGSTIVSGLLGKSAADSAAEEAAEVAKINKKIAEMNLEFQEVARREGIEFAQQMLAEGKLGQTDALGNRTYFREGEGWVTELSPIQALLAQRAQSEQMRQGTDTAARAASAEARSTGMANDSARMFGDATEAIRSAERPDTSQLADLLYARAMGANNEVADAAAGAAYRGLNATGSTSPGRLQALMSGRASQGADAARTAAIDAQLQAMQYGDSRYAQDLSQQSALAEQFGRMAGYSPTASFVTPTGPGRTGETGTYGSQLISAAGATPQQDYITPNYGESNAKMATANLFQSGANSLLGYFQNNQTQNRIDEIAAAVGV